MLEVPAPRGGGTATIVEKIEPPVAGAKSVGVGHRDGWVRGAADTALPFSLPCSGVSGTSESKMKLTVLLMP